MRPDLGVTRCRAQLPAYWMNLPQFDNVQTLDCLLEIDPGDAKHQQVSSHVTLRPILC